MSYFYRISDVCSCTAMPNISETWYLSFTAAVTAWISSKKKNADYPQKWGKKCLPVKLNCTLKSIPFGKLNWLIWKKKSIWMCVILSVYVFYFWYGTLVFWRYIYECHLAGMHLWRWCLHGNGTIWCSWEVIFNVFADRPYHS